MTFQYPKPPIPPQPPTTSIFPSAAGYEYLLAYKITIPIYDYTVEFCRRCKSPAYPSFPDLPSPRSYDQAIQAARSGMTNIPEGYKQKSLRSYIKLAGVAGGSEEELLKDFLSYGRQHGLPIWEKNRVLREVREVGEVWEIIKKTPNLPHNPNFPNLPNDPIKAVNLLITLTNQATYLIRKLTESLELKHTREGGYSENLLKKRLEYRSGVQSAHST